MANWTKEQAQERQDRVFRLAEIKRTTTYKEFLEACATEYFGADDATEALDSVDKLTTGQAYAEKCRANAPKKAQNLRSKRPDTRTATTVGATGERETGAARAQPRRKKNKYGNKRVQIDEIWFDSILEGHRYGQLKLLKSAGEIVDFEMQVVYRLDVNGIHICDYRADFVVRYPDGRIEVEDTKGVETPKFVLQKKLMLAVHGIEIVLIRSKK